MIHWLLAGAAWGGACDPGLVDSLAAAIAAAPRAERLTLAASGWSGLCAGDSVLDMQFGQLSGGLGPDQALIVDLQTVLLDPGGWKTACAGGPLALSMATKLDAAQRRAFVWDKCELARFAAFDAEEWSSVTGLLALPVYAASALSAGGIPAEAARPVVRALAGL